MLSTDMALFTGLFMLAAALMNRGSSAKHPRISPVLTVATLFLFASSASGNAQSNSGSNRFDDELRHVEQRRIQALLTGDRSVLERCIADDYHLISPLGTIDDKAAEIKGAVSGFYLSLIPGPISVRHAGRNSAILRYELAAVVKLAHGPYTSRFWHTDYYERRDGQWQVVWSQSTEVRATPHSTSEAPHAPVGAVEPRTHR